MRLQAIGDTILLGLNSIASQQVSATEKISAKVLNMINHLAPHDLITVHVYASSMVQNIYYGAKYLTEVKSTVRVAGYFYFGSTVHQQKDTILR